MTRHPAVAGRFYPALPEQLSREVDRCLTRPAETRRAIGCVVPHAGYVYSGPVAGAVYGSLALPETLLILAPNHFGRGASLSIYLDGDWETPLGFCPVDATLAAAVLREYPELEADPAAHATEHSLEVQLPFLQRLKPGFTFVPLSIGAGALDVLVDLGEALARAVARDGREVLLVASSDLNHYEPDSITRRKDRRAIDAMVALDAEGLYRTIHREKITMCGFGPAVAMITAAKRLGATSAELVRYATSGDVSGNRHQVVGYAGIVVR